MTHSDILYLRRNPQGPNCHSPLEKSRHNFPTPGLVHHVHAPIVPEHLHPSGLINKDLGPKKLIKT